jgi:hypothetical protein
VTHMVTQVRRDASEQIKAGRTLLEELNLRRQFGMRGVQDYK